VQVAAIDDDVVRQIVERHFVGAELHQRLEEHVLGGGHLEPHQTVVVRARIGGEDGA
jgi:hypothetical protein